MSYKLGIIILSVRDLQQARAFYSQKLGQPVLAEMSNDHFIVVALSNGCLVGLSQLAPGQSVQPGAVEIGLEVPDVDAAWRDWQALGLTGTRTRPARGASVTSPANTDFGRSFDAHDPDGNPLSIYQLAQR
jgi:catechol 2,3-dioxygenase-like lactoylglutathione lyase family enzyme